MSLQAHTEQQTRCIVGDLVASLDAADLAAVESWVVAGYGVPRITDRLRADHKVSESSVRLHRSGSCMCSDRPADVLHGVAK